MDEKELKIVFKYTPRSSWSLGYGLVKAAERLGYKVNNGKIAIYTALHNTTLEEVKENLREFNIAFLGESSCFNTPHQAYKERLKFFDIVITADKEDIDSLYKLGAKKVYYMPCWVDEEMFKPMNVESDINYAFIGKLYWVREKLHKDLSVLPVENIRIFTDDQEESTKKFVEYVNRVKIHFNYPSKFRGLTSRVFEVLSCGRFLLQPAINQDMVFRDRKHFVVYHNTEEAIELARYYLEHTGEREMIVLAGRQEILEKHTGVVRLKQILSLVK